MNKKVLSASTRHVAGLQPLGYFENYQAKIIAGKHYPQAGARSGLGSSEGLYARNLNVFVKQNSG
ncbi:MAG: hypothetical protein M1305_06980 [Candidatus Marsarchaeota archaeon]|nr:hypothetical protein [Candidatus Marsarchaeota archaeon]